jgi:membrane protein
MKLSVAKDLLVSSFNRWSDHNAPRLGAALAYYAVLSMAPLIVLLVAICGLVLDKAVAQQELLRQIRALAGANIAGTVKLLIQNTHQHGTGLLASFIALLTLFFGASGVFVELRESLNTIWDAKTQAGDGIWGFVWQRLASFLMVLVLGLLLTASLAVSAAMVVVEKFFTHLIPLNTAIVAELLNFGLSVLSLALLFALVYKFVPDVSIAWRDVSIGALFTAVFFVIGKSLLALYLTTAAVGSTYGAAGSLVALVVWVYYSAQIFFFGAVFTRVYSERFGSHASSQSKGNLANKLTDNLIARAHSASN